MAQFVVTHQDMREPCNGYLVLNLRSNSRPHALKYTNRARTSLPFLATPWWLVGVFSADVSVRPHPRKVRILLRDIASKTRDACVRRVVARLGMLGG